MEKDILCAARRIDAKAPFHFPQQARPLGDRVRLSVENAPSAPELVLYDRVRGVRWNVATEPTEGGFGADILLPSHPTMLYYHFKFPSFLLRERRQVEKVAAANTPVYAEYEERDFQITVYNPLAMPPAWSRGMVLYQIFPDRFARARAQVIRPKYDVYGRAPVVKEWSELPESPPLGRDFFGGDLLGVSQRIDYLAELGVDCLYLCPVFEALTNHRYDAVDYSKIAKMLGTEAELIELIGRLHARGVRILLDAVFNHCSSDSIYFDRPGRFKGAYQDKNSPYYRWFHFSEWPHEFDRWWGHERYPEFVECPEVEEFFLGESGVTRRWLEYGVDGWRTDATKHNSDAFWRRFRAAACASQPDAYLACEEWEDASHYLAGDMFHAAMNYRFTWALEGFLIRGSITASQFEDRLAAARRDTPAPALLSQINLIGSHDTRRALTACGEDLRLFKLMVGFQMSYPGIPLVYYGDEAGLTGEDGESGRKTFPWGGENQELLKFYKLLISLRRSHPALRLGDFNLLFVDDRERSYAFVRKTGGERIYIVFNAGDERLSRELAPAPDDAGRWQDLINLNVFDVVPGQGLRLDLPPQSFAWFSKIERPA